MGLASYVRTVHQANGIFDGDDKKVCGSSSEFADSKVTLGSGDHKKRTKMSLRADN